MHPTDELVAILKKLRLSGVLQSLELRVRQATDENVAPSEFLLRLLSDEVERRDAKPCPFRTPLPLRPCLSSCYLSPRRHPPAPASTRAQLNCLNCAG
jgi:hypothetical protein